MKYTASFALRSTTFLALPLLILVPAAAQEKTLPCMLSADFEGEGIPAGWDIGAPVTQLDGSNNTTAAWRIGNATEANANGFFPVPDGPVNNRFIMANDDAAPCNCAMDEVVLTGPSIDLTTTTGTVLECRYYLDGNFNSGVAAVDASVNGGEWTVIDTLTAMEAQWQDLFLDLGAFDGAPDLRLRFRWSDNGQWASGLAVDDVCVRGRLQNDLSVLTLLSHDPEPSPFNSEVRSLRYSELPLVEAAPLTLATWLRNSGTNTIRNISAVPAVLLNGVAQGPFATQLVDSLLPGERRLVRIPTDWTPSEVGVVELSVSATSDGSDDDPLDNAASTSMRITGPGWADGYGAMASFEGDAQGTIRREGPFAVLTRMELEGDETAVSGVSTVLGSNTTAGGRIRGILFDAQLAFVDTTITQVLSDEDMNIVNGGGPLFLPWANVTTLSGDHFVGIQVLDGDGDVSIATSGTNPVGASMALTGANFEVDWLRASPMIRLHTSSFGVTVNEVNAAGRLVLGPNPASTVLWYRSDDRVVDEVEVMDMWGRSVRVPHFLTAGRGGGQLDVSSLSNGFYTLTIHVDGQQIRRNFLITR